MSTMSRYYDFFCPVKLMAGEQALEQLAGELAGLGRASRCCSPTRGQRYWPRHPAGRGSGRRELPVAAIWDEIPADSSTAVVERIAARHRSSAVTAWWRWAAAPSSTPPRRSTFSPPWGNAAAGLRRRRLPDPAAATAGGGAHHGGHRLGGDPGGGDQDEASGRALYLPPFLLPQLAVLDPRLTQGLPLNITAATAMDAMTHAIEAFIGNAKNPISDALALMAVEKIASALPQVLNNPQDKRLRLQLAEGSTLAGMAFSNSMVGLVHALGHSLGPLPPTTACA